MHMHVPSTTGSNGATNGRDSNGRFASGNGFARGNPHASAVAQMRSAFLRAATPERMERLANKLMQMAEGGDLDAARLLLDRVFGRPVQPIDMAPMPADEAASDVPGIADLRPGELEQLGKLRQIVEDVVSRNGTPR